ncbi:1-phosphofructokinase [Gordonia effusa NBRC 100432]|uniref:1-phosphofructokinase n=1 Tax=Gordonia effusa NBRC 100432 TaxID=1077974 RepID=H0QYQ2_9ACTN|nr:1-phosphofructokinase family hexose kinase [Gordonia effusa]GAB17953.1 1-phosphofructokinase [Gordonia effusa NBRC 100432]
MILTITVNPSIDRTVELAEPLEPGAVQRATASRVEAGGKGVNVARVVASAGNDALAVLPARQTDALLRLLDDVSLPYRCIDIHQDVRSNITIVDPDGTTTKINAAGAELDTATDTALTDLIDQLAPDAHWIALCGSLPPGLPDDWYARIAERLAARGANVAVDTSGAPLKAVARPGIGLLKPNADELAELVGGSGPEIESLAATGDFTSASIAAQTLAARTGGAVLTTLGAAGALLTIGPRTWSATTPPITPRSTVGAGDASLAGYLLADLDGETPPERLRRAVAYGSAAAALPGTQPPSPTHLDLTNVHVTELPLSTTV